MNTTCWNCQGVGNSLAVRHLKDILGQYNPQVLFLSETKQKRTYMEKLCEEMGFFDLVTVEPQGLSGGLALLWQEEVRVSVCSTSTRWIDTHMHWKDKSFYLTGVYGDPIPTEREDVWEALIRLGENREGPWILLGDFNEILNNEEKRGGRARAESSFYAFRNMILKCGLQELPYEGNSLSWFGSRGGELVHCKLDRVLANTEWFLSYPSARSEYLARIGSDHSPIFTSFSGIKPRRKGHFRYDSRWRSSSELSDIIKSNWRASDLEDSADIIARLRRCRSAISHWKKTNHVNSKQQIHELKQQLDFLSQRDSMDWNLFKDLKRQLMEAYLEEEKFWRERSRALWLKEGDRNSKYFHASVKQRRVRNKILQLTDTDTGTVYYDCRDFKRLAHRFFMNLYTSELIDTSAVRYSPMFQNVPIKVTSAHNDMLTADVTDREIKIAVFDMAPEKCPGPDGFSGSFYQQHWDTVGSQVGKVVKNFLQHGLFDNRLNETNICLIPKISKPTKLTEFRPISLCNFAYKVIAKVLSSRLKRILPDIISETQAAFVSGRLISDNILLAHELVHNLKTHPDLSTSGVAIKTDMMKAFDRVEWQFLEDSMRTLGFNERWISWIMICITTVSFGVLINGELSPHFQPSRGIRQGDPLSPFLFILCTEVLIIRLQRRDVDQRIAGIQIAPSAPHISHLFFADDSLFFSTIRDSQLLILKAILKEYEEASGQRINLNKSSIIYGTKMTDADKTQVKAEMGITQEGGTGVYLGLPEVFVGSKINTLRFIEEKTKQRINSWHHRYLSPGGKEVLLKAVAYAIPAYTMSCYLLPKEMIQRLHQEFAKFWWKNNKTGKGIHWMAWDKLIRHKEDGGLGFRSLEGANLALLGKQYWRLATKPHSLLALTMKARYYPNSSILHAKIGNRPSYGWRSVLSSQHLMQFGMKKEIGNGTSLNFWNDPWIVDEMPRPPIPKHLSSRQEWTLADFKEDFSDQWRITELRRVMDAADVNRILQVVPGGEGSQQSYSWIHSNNGDYSVKSGYVLWFNRFHNTTLAPEQQPSYSQIYKTIWSTNTSSKVKHFLWKCSVSALSVGVEMRKKRLTREDTCQVCGIEAEDVRHLIFTCPMARAFWALSPFAAILNDTSCSFNGQLYACAQLSESVHEEDKNLWPWMMWRIWKMRNEFVFQGKSPDIVLGFHTAKADYMEWRHHTTETEQLRNPTPPVINEVMTWIPPGAGSLKCNTDATWHKDKDKCGVGWVLRDDMGRVKFWGAKTYPQLRSPLEAEASSLIWAAKCIGNMGYDSVIFESDSSSLVEAIHVPTKWPRLLTFSTEFQDKITRLERNFRVQKVSREGNRAADRLANFAQEQELYFGTIDNMVPLWFQPFLDANDVISY